MWAVDFNSENPQLMLILQENRENHSIQFGYDGDYIKQSIAHDHVHLRLHFQAD